MIAIRAATVRDARAIAEVHVASWRWAYRDTFPAAALDALDVDERARTWSERLGDGDPLTETLVADDDGAVVGFCGYGPCREGDAPPGTAEVYAIYLREEAAGRGVGRALFTRANERLRALGYRRATLWVLETNERTRRFYEAAGWAADGAGSAHRLGRATLPIVRYGVDLAVP